MGSGRGTIVSWAAASIAAGLAAVASVASCSSSEDPSVQLLDESEASAAAPSWGATACAGCISKTCADERSRCAAEPTCARYLECVGACPASVARPTTPDADCVAACPRVAGSAAEAAAAAFVACVEVGPGPDCTGCAAPRFRSPVLNQVCPASTVDAEASCPSCRAQRCCKTKDACNADPACVALGDCYVACSTAACKDQCAAEAGTSADTYFTHIGCLVIRCTGPCTDSPTTPCEACQFSACADDKIACDGAGDCRQLRTCVGQCTTANASTCFPDCARRYPNGTALLAAQLLCLRERCPACN